MATGADPKKPTDNLDDLLKCTICLDTFKEPKYLPCLHTFCKLCIHKYIDSLKEKEGEIPCPLCRMLVSSVDSLGDTASIVDKLPTNNFVVTLLEKQTITERECTFCNLDGRREKASVWCGICEESYCERCVKIHKSNKSLTKHKIVSIKDMQNKTIDLNEMAVVFCDDHRDTVVQVYCVDHKKACCTLCATLSHRKCDHVISIEEAAAGIKQKSEVTDLISKLKEFEVLLAEAINLRNGDEEKFESDKNEIETVVIKMVKEMKDHLDKIQNQILGKLGAAKKQMSMKVADDINDFTSYKSAVTNWKNMMSGVIKHGSEQQCLVIQNEIASKVEKLQDEIKDAITKIRNTSVKFEVSTLVKEFREKVTSIGELKVDESKIKYEKGKLGLFRNDFLNGEIKVIRTINVTPSGQTSGIFLDDVMIFTAYRTNKVVKYNQKGELLGELTVQSTPTDCCHLAETRVVVSSSPHELHIVDSQNMTLQKTIKLASDIPVWGVCVYDNNQFLIGDWGQLTWIDQSSGTKVKSVKTSGYSCYVSTTGNNDYIYGDGINSVSYVVNDTKKFTYTNNQLSCPYGIGIDDQLNFYIAGYTSKNIHQITNTGELVRSIPASTVGVRSPWIVRFAKGSNRFLVTCNETGKASLCCIE